jgi:hypothetical protein
MSSARSTKQKHDTQWTFVASAKRATPRLVLVSDLDAKPRGRRPKHSVRPPDTSKLGIRLEHAFKQAVKAAKRNATTKA